MTVVFLHLGGAGTFTAASVVAFIFVAIFTLSFLFSGRPEGARKFSAAWARAWLKSSLPRLAVAAVFSAALFAGSAQFGTGAATACDKPVPPLSRQPVTTEQLETGIADLRRMAEAARAGDSPLVDSLFFSKAHNVTHAIDGPLRSADPGLAKTLCRNVFDMEKEFAGERRLDVLAARAETVAGLLTEAGRTLEPAP